MKTLSTLLSLGLILGLSACGSPEAASRAEAPALALTMSPAAGVGQVEKRVAIPLKVVAVTVKVPTTLRVSEANTWYPNADVVWRGEPRANRLDQVTRIFEDAARAGTGNLTKGYAVIAEIEVVRFHCVTEKTRNSIGGTHSMQFMLTVRDAETGAVLDGPRLVVADVKAAGGSKAIAEDYAGRTQRVVVVDRLARVLQHELKVLTVNSAKLGMTVSMSETDPAQMIVTAAN